MDRVGEEGWCHFSGVGDPLKMGPASNSVVMCGYQCPEPRNGAALRSQIDWIGIKEGKLQLWSEVLETLIQEEGLGSNLVYHFGSKKSTPPLSAPIFSQIIKLTGLARARQSQVVSPRSY